MTNYPEQIDDTTSLPTVTDGVSNISAASINRLREAIIAVERELGVNPSSTYGTIDDRLDALDAALDASDLRAVDFSIADVDGYFVSTNVEGALAEAGAVLANTTSIASEVSITDTDGYYASGNVEGALAEIGALLSQPSASNASELSIADADGYFVSTNVEDALQEIAKLNLKFVSGEIEQLTAKSYPILLNSPYAAAPKSLTLETSVGTADGYIQVNGSQIESAVSASTIQSSYDYLGSTWGTGDDLALAVENISGARNLKFTFAYTVDG